MNFKAVIFDCDGTLVDSEHAHYVGWQHGLRQQGSDMTLEEYRFFVGKPPETISRLLSEKMGRNCGSKILEDKQAHYHHLQTAGLPSIEGTVNLVHRLASKKKSLDIKLAVASAANKEEIIRNLIHLGIEQHFDIVISGQSDLKDYSDPEGTNKPKPYIYLHTAKMLNVLPSQCIVIEDSHSGVTAGVDAGCFTIAVPNSFTKQQDLSRAQYQINSFEDMSVDHFLKMI